MVTNSQILCCATRIGRRPAFSMQVVMGERSGIAAFAGGVSGIVRIPKVGIMHWPTRRSVRRTPKPRTRHPRRPDSWRLRCDGGKRIPRGRTMRLPPTDLHPSLRDSHHAQNPTKTRLANWNVGLRPNHSRKRVLFNSRCTPEPASLTALGTDRATFLTGLTHSIASSPE